MENLLHRKDEDYKNYFSDLIIPETIDFDYHKPIKEGAIINLPQIPDKLYKVIRCRENEVGAYAITGIEEKPKQP